MRLIGVVLLCMLVCAGAVRAEEPLRVVVTLDSPPYSFVNPQGQRVGYDVDVAEALCRIMGRACVMQTAPFEEIIPGLTQGLYDFAVANMGYSEERGKQVIFSEKYNESYNMYVGREGAKTVTEPSMLYGMRLGAQKGTIHETYLNEMYRGKSQIVLFEQKTDMFTALREGQLEYIMLDGPSANTYLLQDINSKLEPASAPVRSELLANDSYIGISPKRPELAAVVNAALRILRESGEHVRINRRYFDYGLR